MGNRFDYRFPILNLQKGKRNNGRYRDLWYHCSIYSLNVMTIYPNIAFHVLFQRRHFDRSMIRPNQFLKQNYVMAFRRPTHQIIRNIRKFGGIFVT